MGIELLTEIEQEIIKLIGHGLKDVEIAETLKISEQAVKTHLTSIFGKLDVTSRLKLVICAYQKGLI